MMRYVSKHIPGTFRDYNGITCGCGMDFYHSALGYFHRNIVDGSEPHKHHWRAIQHSEVHKREAELLRDTGLRIVCNSYRGSKWCRVGTGKKHCFNIKVETLFEMYSRGTLTTYLRERTNASLRRAR